MNTNEEIFIKVVETGSLKAAAELLGTDPSSISRKIGALEGRLGVKLLIRSTRRSEPTEIGKNYYERALHDHVNTIFTKFIAKILRFCR